MKWGGGGGPEGGGPGCCAEVHGVNGVQGGGGPEAYTTPYTTQHKHATCTGGEVGPAGHGPSSLQPYTKAVDQLLA
jgi:hypothetical protein